MIREHYLSGADPSSDMAAEIEEEDTDNPFNDEIEGEIV